MFSLSLFFETLHTAKLFMLCNVSKKESENIKARIKIYAARDFSNKYDHAFLGIYRPFRQLNFISFSILFSLENFPPSKSVF
jgi:hypothetical protein